MEEQHFHLLSGSLGHSACLEGECVMLVCLSPNFLQTALYWSLLWEMGRLYAVAKSFLTGSSDSLFSSLCSRLLEWDESHRLSFSSPIL